jgi:hypothetical protein
MNALVIDETIAPCASIVTLIAGEWTLAGMSTLVRNESAACYASMVALVAGVQALTRMKIRMSSEIVPLRT